MHDNNTEQVVSRRYFGGRADMTSLFTMRVKHRLSKEVFRRRIVLAWANLRLRHVMLMGRTSYEEASRKRKFVIDLHDSRESVIDDVLRSIVWVEDHFEEIDGIEIYHHALNVGRIVEPEGCLSKLHVLPLVKMADGTHELRFLVVMAHQISDGMSAYNWFSDFVRILNLSEENLNEEVEAFRQEREVGRRLPPAQEDIYPRNMTNKAKERWFWAIIRVLRYLRKTNSQSFVNPLRREARLTGAVSFTPKFDKIFDYAEASKPPMNSDHMAARLSAHASQRMMNLCRSIRVSIGAGCFALAGLAMMIIYEERYPDIPNDKRLPFSASFPLNPRAFFGSNTPADSCMLAFSEGIMMPFLPSSLPIEGRFKLIATHANRELRMYQKRAKATSVGLQGPFNPHDPARLLANAYLGAIERADARLPEDERWGANPQGDLQPSAFQSRATCGVSSIGATAQWLAAGKYDLNAVWDNGKDMVADFRELRQGVRARDDEFLVGSSTDAEGRVRFGVSYDENAISPEMAGRWRDVIEGLMEGGGRGLEKARI